MAFRKNIPSRMNSKSTGSKAAVRFASSKNSTEASTAGAEPPRGGGGAEVKRRKQDGRCRRTVESLQGQERAVPFTLMGEF